MQIINVLMFLFCSGGFLGFLFTLYRDAVKGESSTSKFISLLPTLYIAYMVISYQSNLWLTTPL